ncbi:hypothetical protein TSAR_011791 [Trichomalopsis sarcophagae]|uniref:BTB domain-containing protein n=1 Tax=Trichomalopsis sarcophagae TaxID=543379 RepID=A0A232EUD2_9HYME|nr:hypothetical protein TSAR_011791 [Trichomalopsis sarcophagae]
MSKRKSENSANCEAKKKNISTLVAYVEQIVDEKTFTNKVKNVDFTIKKVILNNNDDVKIQCNLYNEIIDVFSANLKLNEKILIRNATAVSAKAYTKGNLTFEINLQSFTTITSLEEFEWKNVNIYNIDFDEIPTKIGFLTGFLFNEFTQRNKTNENEYFGSITNKKNKSDILLHKTKNESIDYELGCKIDVTSNLQENVMKEMLRFIYTDKANIESLPIMDLLAAADKYQQRSLRRITGMR